MLNDLLRKWKIRPDPTCSVVIVAAGQSSRMQGTDKILTPLDGQPVICHTIAVFQNSPLVKEIILVTREELLETLQDQCRLRGYDKVTSVVKGGADRICSVMNGLDHVTKKSGLVAIHDGARPLVTAEIIEETLRQAARYHAAAPAIPVKDTIKATEGNLVTETPDRTKLFAVQTPQIFDFDLLRGALKKAMDENLPVTDDCSAVEALGMKVFLSMGSEENIKITTPFDLVLADAIVHRRKQG